MTGVTKLKHAAAISYGLGQPPELSDSGIPILRATNIQRGKICRQGLIFAAIDDLPLDRAPLLRADEILVVRSGAYTGDSALVTEEWTGSSPGYDLRLTPYPSAEPRFLAYTLLSSRALSEMELLSSRAAQPHLNAEELGEVSIRLPVVTEQRAISDYLDAETARIDAIIAKKQQLIHLLEERRKTELESLLWSGPTVRLRFVAELLPGYAFPSAHFGPGASGLKLLRGTNVGVGTIDWSDEVRLTEGHADAHPVDKYLLEAGDLALGMDRPFIKRGTRVAEIGLSDEGCALVQRVCRIRPTHGESHVMLSALASERFAGYVQADLTGVSVPHLSDEQIGNFAVPLDLDEVESERVRILIGEISEVRALLADQISLLTERRQALITAAVTGEFKVPGVA